MSSNSIVFQSLDWQYYDENFKFIIHVFGRERQSNNIINVKILGYQPYFYIKVKDDPEQINLIKSTLISWDNKYHPALTIKQEYHKKFYDYRAGKQNLFLKLSFVSLYSFNQYHKKCKDLQLPTYEAQLKPLFRFYYDVGVEPVSWIQIDKYIAQRREIPKQRHYTLFDEVDIRVQYQDLIVRKDIIGFSEITIGSFDIETYSKSRRFPQATNESDCIIQIGLTISKIGTPDPHIRVILVLDTCDKLDDITVVQCKTEQQLLIKFCQMLDVYRPDILTGYNIYGFDFKYIYDRIVFHGLEDDLMTEFNRKQIKGMSHMTEKKIYEKDGKKIKHILHYPQIKGYTHFDLFHHISNNFSLAQVNLAYVSQVFLSNETKKCEGPTVYCQNPKLRTGDWVSFMYNDGYIDQQHKNGKKYQVIDIQTDKFVVSEHIGLDGFQVKYSVTKDDVSPEQIFEYQEKDSYHRSLVAKYCIQDCELVNRIINKLLIVQNIISMANVNFVTISNIILNGQGIKAYSLVSQFTRKNGYLIIDRKLGKSSEHKKQTTGRIDHKISFDKQLISIPYNPSNTQVNDILDQYGLLSKVNQNKDRVTMTTKEYRFIKKQIRNTQLIQPDMNDDNDNYAGAVVLEPNPEVIKDPVYVCDYQSLYPMGMIAGNISHEMYIRKKKYLSNNDIVIEEVEYVNDTIKPICSYYYAKVEDYIPVLTQVLRHLLDQRKYYRKLAQKAWDEGNIELYQIYDAVQLAYKITANSIYGQLGTNKSYIFHNQMALCTTSIGKQMLIQAKQFTQVQFQNLVRLLYSKESFLEYFVSYFENEACNTSIIKQFKFKNKDRMLQQYNNKYDNWSDLAIHIYDELSQIFKGIDTRKVIIKTIYGDTDSIFNRLVVPGISQYETRKIAIALGNLSVGLINLVLPYPQNLQYEKVLHPLIIISKKKYVGNLYENNPDKYKQKSMGIDIKKRSISPICRLICRQIIQDILEIDNVSINSIIDKVRTHFKNIIDGKYDIEYFIMTKKLQAGYKEGKIVNHQILADRMKARQEDSSKYQIGSRIKYVFIDLGVSYKKYEANKLKQHEFMEDPEYIQKKRLKINYMFYLMRHIKKPCYDFLQLLDKNIDSKFQDIYQYGNMKLLGQVDINEVSQDSNQRAKQLLGNSVYI